MDLKRSLSELSEGARRRYGLGLGDVLDVHWVTDDDFRSDVDNVFVAIKGGVAVVVLLLCMANRRKPAVSEQVFFSIFGLTMINIGVAVFWR